MSGFGGRVLLTKQPESNTANTLTMKKGANVPPQMRSNFKRNKEMSQMREEMEASSRPGADGFPIFNLYVRSQKSPVSTLLYFSVKSSCCPYILYGESAPYRNP